MGVDLKTLRNELKERTTKMNSSLSLSSSYEFSSKNTRATSEMRDLRGSSEVSNEFYTAMNTDLDRLNREFYYPQPIKETGNYYPRFPALEGLRLAVATSPIWRALTTSTACPASTGSANTAQSERLASGERGEYYDQNYMICFAHNFY